MMRSFKISWFILGLSLLVTAGIVGCSKEDPYQEYEREQRELDDKYIQDYLTGNNITNYTKTSTGLYYLPQQPGTGAKIQQGNTVTMHYVGKFLNGQVFDSSYDDGLPLTFTVGSGQVIRGWDQGALLLSNQEKATLIVPSHLGYGRYGSGSVPSGAVLVFDIDVKNVK